MRPIVTRFAPEKGRVEAADRRLRVHWDTMETGDGPAAAAAGPPPGGGPARAWARAFGHDLRTHPPAVVLLRGLRRARLLLDPGRVRALLASPSLAAHAAAEGGGDPLFCLSSRHYLARDLAPRARIAAAACHYPELDRRFDAAWLRAVNGAGEGLVLWRHPVGAHDHDIVLRRGRDVADEGALSLIFRVDRGIHCVLSFTRVPGRLLQAPGGPPLPGAVWFISRKHLTMRRDYQADFHRAFHRVGPAQMALAAFSGMACALGDEAAVCIGAARQPSNAPERAGQFATAYDGFWRACGARPLGANFLLPLPLPRRPAESLPGPKRKRARLRQAARQEVEDAAFAVTRQHLAG